MSKDARNWGFPVVTWSFVDLSLLVNYVRRDFKSFSLAHCFTDQVLIRCLDGEALTFLLVVLPLLLHRLSLAAVSGAPLWLWGMGSSLQWLLLLGRRALGMWAQ